MRNKKNLLKTMLVLAMALIMTLAMSITAFAAGTHTLTITPVDDKGHEFKVYKVFSGTESSGTLSDVAWAITDAEVTALKTAWNANKTKLGTSVDLTVGMTASDVAAEMAKLSGENALDALGEVLATAITTTTAAATITCPVGDATAKTASALDDGYYFVKETTASIPAGSARARYMLQVLGNVTITATQKASVPSLTKTFADDTTANVAGIGEEIEYKLTTAVPDMTGYNKYFFIISDQMSTGLTKTAAAPVVTLGGVTLVENTDYVVNTVAPNGFEIVFKNFVSHLADKGKAIVVTYKAVLNENADRTDAGNTNTANLTYSNDPNVTYAGDSSGDKPGSTEPTGVTPDSTVKTYTTALKLVKIDGSSDNIVMKGATFNIKSSDKTKKVLVESGQTFTASSTGTYYKLNNGTYTKEDPTTATASYYASTTDKYALTSTLASETIASTLDITKAVDDKGELYIGDLGTGTYVIKETIPPAGYNALASDLTVKIEATPDATSAHWVVSDMTSGSPVALTLVGDTYVLEVKNNKGLVLPSTGGIGTTVFYLVGGVLVLGAAILLITKKRMSSEEE